MPEFIVVDLGSQARAVGQHVEGWPRSCVLAWLRQFGEVCYEPYFSRPGVDHYSFVSPCGRSNGAAASGSKQTRSCYRNVIEPESDWSRCRAQLTEGSERIKSHCSCGRVKGTPCAKGFCGAGAGTLSSAQGAFLGPPEEAFRVSAEAYPH